jgi:TonB family protein
VNSSWSDGFARLAGPLAVSLGLHLSVGAALDSLPWRVPGSALERHQQGGQRLQVALRSSPPPSAAPTPQFLPPVPPVAGPSGTAGEPQAQYFLARELDARPVALAPIEPAYPNDAYLRDVPGSVLVRLHISETGEVEKAVILRADPPGQFEDAVQRAFLTARFSPGMRGGRPVKVQMTVEVRYESPRAEAAPGADSVPLK